MEVINSLKKHRKVNPFVQIDRAIIDDPRLSWKAKGLLMYLLAQSDSWQFYESEICSHSTDGRTSVASGLNELEECGYLVRTWMRNDKGQFAGRQWDVFEEPLSTSPDSDQSGTNSEEIYKGEAGCRKPDSGSKSTKTPGCRKPETGISEAGKPATNNINSNNKEDEEEKLSGVDTDLQKDADDFNIHDKDLNFFEEYTSIELDGYARKQTYRKWREAWGFSPEMIIKAADLMCQLAKTPNLTYIDQILYDWKLQNIYTNTAADEAVKKYRAQKRNRSGIKSTIKNIKSVTSQDAEYEIFSLPI